MLDDEVSSHDSLRGFALSMGQADEAVELNTAMQIFAAANRFYAKIGMDLDLKEEAEVAVGEYSDIEELPPDGDPAAEGAA